jgi:hypothetical protein
VGLSAQRAAENENLFRRINERVEALAAGHDELPIVCECSDPGCVERLNVPHGTYEHARSQPAWFLLAPGHEKAELEQVVERGDGWLLVAKRGEAAAVARADDPRSE